VMRASDLSKRLITFLVASTLAISPIFTSASYVNASTTSKRKDAPHYNRNAAGQSQAGGQTPGETSKSDPQIQLSTSEVLLDVVVRDKKGRPVRDLSSSDFEVYEDGKKQQLESFRLHERVPGNPGESNSGVVAGEKGAVSPASTTNPFAGVNVVAMVFDNLSLEGRVLAQKAALNCIAQTFSPSDFAGIFSIDLTLRILQPFTNNRERIGSAIANMLLPNGTRDIQGESAATANVSEYLASTAAANPAGLPEAMGSFATPADRAAAGLTANVISSFQTLERNQQSYAEMYSLLAIINSLRGVEGRKAVVLFSEGLSITSDTIDKFRSVIAQANRANVTFYTIDAAGLRVRSTTRATARQVNRLANSRADSSLSGVEDTSGQPMSFDLENNETILNLDPAVGLTQIAEQTGGFMINQTNDLNPGLSRIGEDIRSYYVMTYSPQNQEYDGRFRKISVKVNRPGVDVETRKGYYAIRKPSPMPVSDWESPALAILKSGGHENALTMRAKVFNFPEVSKPGLAPVLVEVPASTLKYEVDPGENIYKSDLSIVVLIKDLSDQVVAKVGNHYQITGPANKLESARQGNILFYRETDLDPGLYFVEAVAYDAKTGSASVRDSSIEVPYYNAGGAPRLSSVIVLRSAEALTPQNEKEQNPFHYGQTLMYPNMGEPLSRSKRKELAFYFDVYPAKKGAPKLTVEILKNNQVLTSGSPALGAPDETGRIQYVSALPLSRFQTGDYTLRITITQGQASVSRFTNFTVQP